MRRWLIGGTVVVVMLALVAGVIALSGVTGARPDATPTPLPPVPSADRVVAEARVVPASHATIESSALGPVATVAVAEGDRVTAGMTLVTLEGAEAEAQVRGAQAALDAAIARYDQAVSAADDLEPDDDAAIRAADADVTQAAAALEGAEAALASLTLTAPIAGTVAEVAVSPGDVVSPGVTLVRLAGDGGWSFETTDLTQDEVAAIAVGADASITVDGFAGDVIAGRVTSIAGYGVDRQGDVVFRTVIEPSGDVPAGIRWGMLASVEITTTGR